MAAFLDEATTNLITANTPQTLTDWVKNFRLKKIQMKRKYRHGSNLRVCAMLTTALNSAEQELKRKQQERFHKWAEMQSKGYFSCNDKTTNLSSNYYNYPNTSCASEVRSSFYYSNQNNPNNSNLTNCFGERNCVQQQRDSINDLWKSELSGLDQFMKNMSSGRCSVLN